MSKHRGIMGGHEGHGGYAGVHPAELHHGAPPQAPQVEPGANANISVPDGREKASHGLHLRRSKVFSVHEKRGERG